MQGSAGTAAAELANKAHSYYPGALQASSGNHDPYTAASMGEDRPNQHPMESAGYPGVASLEQRSLAEKYGGMGSESGGGLGMSG